MEIVRVLQSELFLNQLNHILDFLAEYSQNSKNEFKNELLGSLLELDFMPYKFRKSLSFDDNNIRDFIFRGFVIPYLIDKESDVILIIAIFRENILNTKELF